MQLLVHLKEHFSKTFEGNRVLLNQLIGAEQISYQKDVKIEKLNVYFDGVILCDKGLPV